MSGITKVEINTIESYPNGSSSMAQVMHDVSPFIDWPTAVTRIISNEYEMEKAALEAKLITSYSILTVLHNDGGRQHLFTSAWERAE
jgi:hypothetical protein